MSPAIGPQSASNKYLLEEEIIIVVDQIPTCLCLEPSYFGIAVGLDYGRHRSKGSLGPDPSYFQEIFPRDLPVESKSVFIIDI